MRSPRRALLLAASLLLVATPSIHAQSDARLRVGITAPATAAGTTLPAMPRRQASADWKTGVILGVGLGVLFGITVASWDGDEGSDRTAGDRISSGLVAAGIVAVPATVIFALLLGEE